MPSCSDLGEGHVGIEVLDQTVIELPGSERAVCQEGNGQRKPGTTRGSPRRSRTAKALRISRHAVKSRCARGVGARAAGRGQHDEQALDAFRRIDVASHSS